MIEILRGSVRGVMRHVARALDKASGGRISPDMVTTVGLVAHIFIAFVLARGNLWQAGILLIVFGLSDTLDGELARLQGSAGPAGMVLDSVTDRAKEIMLYSAAAYYFVHNGEANFAVWSVIACGSALLVSYTNAWGEATATKQKLTSHPLNKTFRNGLMSFDIRMLMLVIGLIIGRLDISIVIIAVLSAYTALQRFLAIRKRLSN